MIKFPYKEKTLFKLDLIPMINVVFLLLIFFMLTSTTTKQTKKVELPKARTAEKNSKEYLVMTIDKKGSMELDGKAVTLEVLPTHLEEKINEMINQKSQLAEDVLGSGESWLANLSIEELTELVSLETHNPEF